MNKHENHVYWAIYDCIIHKKDIHLHIEKINHFIPRVKPLSFLTGLIEMVASETFYFRKLQSYRDNSFETFITGHSGLTVL